MIFTHTTPLVAHSVLNLKKLRSHLFSIIDDSTPTIFLIAACTDRVKTSFENMIGKLITHFHWPLASQMQNRRVSFEFNYSVKPLKRTNAMLAVQMVAPDNQGTSRFISYSNTRKSIQSLKDKLDTFLNSRDSLHMKDTIIFHRAIPR